MDPILFPLFAQAFGSVAGPILQKAAEKHVQDFFGDALSTLAAKGQKDPLVEAMRRAYATCFEMILRNLLGVGLDPEDFKPYENAVRAFLDDATVAEELLKPAIDPADRLSPDAEVLRDAWLRLECPALPSGFNWQNVVNGYRVQVDKEKIASNALREEFSAANLLDIRENMRQIAGVQPEADIVRYAQRMRTKYRVLNLTALQSPTTDEPGPILLRQAFVPQNVRENPPAEELPRDVLKKLVEDGDWSEDERRRNEIEPEQLEKLRKIYAKRPARPVLDVVGENDNRRMIVIGGPGSGKSTLTRYLLLTLLAREDEPPKWTVAFKDHLPLLVELREYNIERAEGRVDSFLNYWHRLGREEGYSLNETWLHDRLRSGPSLVLFDGLDEIFDPKSRDRIAQSIVGFASDYPKARLVVTSRSVGYNAKILRDADFKYFGLEDLDNKQIEAFIQGWFGLVFPNRPKEAEQRIERIRTATQSSKPIRLLAGNPMLLTIMTMIAQLQDLPRERWRFYDYAAEVLCHHWDVNRHLEDERLNAPYVGPEDKKEMLRWIAYHMQEGEKGLAGNVIRGAKLLDVISDFLKKRYELPAAEAKRVAEALIDQLRRRNYILCSWRPGLYGFVHRTFLEYFCAAQLAEMLEKTPAFTIETLRDDFFAKHYEDPAWAEPLRLICGMVGEGYAAVLIDFLAVDDEWPPDKYLGVFGVRAVPQRLDLAAQCLLEVQKRHELGDTSARLMDIFVQRAESDENESVRWMAMESLASTWPQDEGIRDLLVQRAEKDDSEYVRSTAVQSLASTCGWEVKVVLSQDLDLFSPFLDPLEPIPDEHLREAAKRLNIDEDELRRQVADAESVLGWNPLVGLKASRDG